MLDLNYDITRLRGAEYNPRHINEDDLTKLAESIRDLGLVKPLIVRGTLLVAGHQRTKALRSLGYTTAPVYVLPRDTTTYDEVRFNQLHNGTDMDGGDEMVRITGGFDALGFTIVEPSRITGNYRSKLANVRTAIADLIVKYGPWGGVVATKSGRVIHAAQYALAAGLTRTKLTTFVIADADEGKYRAFLDRQYGVFSYTHLKKDTFIQTLAQMKRLRGQTRGGKSTLYEQHVIPFAMKNKTARFIDFGSGQGDYANAMRKRGLDFFDIELFRRVGASQSIDMREVNTMVTAMTRSLYDNGPYDHVVCDSVLNSVDCRQAETAVMTVLNMLAAKGGRVFFSGRPVEAIEHMNNTTKIQNSRRYVEFPDKDGFTALYRDGRWFYQKFHTKPEAAAIAPRFGFRALVHSHTGTSWQIEAVKERDLPLDDMLAACDYEFDLPVSDDRRLGRGEDVKAAVRAIYG
jgi:ParB family chromosome partitioning protein